MNLLLHPRTASQWAAVEQTPTGSVIFHGPAGLGKASAAKELAMRLNCLDGKPGSCAHCRQIAAGNFPDFLWLNEADKASIGIEAVRNIISELSLRPYGDTGTRVVVIENAQLLTLEAQNALLKQLEEPPPKTLIILLATHLETLLVTVRSRCRSVRFSMPGITSVSKWLTDAHGTPGPVAHAAATASAGAPGTALELATNPDQAGALTNLIEQAGNLSNKSLFDRLLLAAKLASGGDNASLFGEALHRRLVTETAAGQLDPARVSAQLLALERFRLQLNAKVNQRAALERLMLELA